MKNTRKNWLICRIVVGAMVLAASSGCSRTDGAYETTSSQVMIRTELYFGLSKPDGSEISEREWDDFVDRHVTPRFKEGFTVLDAHGQWQEASGKVIHENSRVLIILHADTRAADESIEAIRADYKRLFKQSSVLKATSAVKASF